MFKPLKVLVAALVIAKSCTLSLGSGSSDDGPPDSGSPALGVPWVMQINSEYCGPASIMMWALFDGVTDLTQQQIGTYIGASATTGSSQEEIVEGVIHFTASGRDAALDAGGGTNDQVGL